MTGQPREMLMWFNANIAHKQHGHEQVKPNGLHDVRREDEIERYYKAVWKSRNLRDMVVIKTFLYTGVRVSELVNIKLTDVDYDRCLIRAVKEDRLVPYPASFKEVLVMHADRMRQQKAEYLFESNWKRPYTDRGARRILTKYVELAGIKRKISPHRLRHFFLTWLKNQGVEDALIQPYSGHSTPYSLEAYYTRSINEAQEEYDRVLDSFPV
jgi:integrase/recombinase XerD